MRNSRENSMRSIKESEMKIHSRNSKIANKNIKQFNKYHVSHKIIGSQRVIKAPSLSMSYITAKGSDRELGEEKSIKHLKHSRAGSSISKEHHSSVKHSQLNKTIKLGKKKKSQYENNPFNRSAMNAFTFERDNRNKIIKINGISNSVDFTAPLRKHNVKNTMKSLIKSKHASIDTMIKGKQKMFKFSSGLQKSKEEVDPTKNNQAMMTEKDIQTELKLPTLRIRESAKSIDLLKEGTFTYTVNDSSVPEAYTSEKGNFGQAHKAFMTSTSFEVETIHEQLLASSIQDALKLIDNQITVNGFDTEIENKAIISCADQVCDWFSHDYMQETDELEVIQRQTSNQIVDLMIDFSRKIFLDQHQMNDKLELWTKYDYEFVTVHPNEKSITNTLSDDLCISRRVSAPVESLNRLRSKELASEYSSDIQNRSAEKIEVKAEYRFKIMSKTYSIDALILRRRYGSISVQQFRQSTSGTSMAHLIKSDFKDKEDTDFYENMRTGTIRRRVQERSTFQKRDRGIIFDQFLDTQKIINHEENKHSRIDEDEDEY